MSVNEFLLVWVVGYILGCVLAGLLILLTAQMIRRWQ